LTGLNSKATTSVDRIAMTVTCGSCSEAIRIWNRLTASRHRPRIAARARM
jgi:hypothetical protein